MGLDGAVALAGPLSGSSSTVGATEGSGSFGPPPVVTMRTIDQLTGTIDALAGTIDSL